MIQKKETSIEKKMKKKRNRNIKKKLEHKEKGKNLFLGGSTQNNEAKEKREEARIREKKETISNKIIFFE